MRNWMLSLMLLALCAHTDAQETRTEFTNPATNAEDHRPNNVSVPEGYAVPGNFVKVLVMRFKYRTDLLAGIDSLAHTLKIRNAVILSGIGSVRNYRYHIVGNGSFPSKDIFIENPQGAADVASMNGYIIEGRVHAHITFSDSTRAFGGHLERGTSVFTFAIVTVGVLSEDIDIKRVDDKTYR